MSVDVSLADPISTLSPWQRFLFRQVAEREIANAALRAELDGQPILPRTAADAQRDIKRYKAMLKVPAVLASKWWIEDVTTKLTAARTELKALRQVGGGQ